MQLLEPVKALGLARSGGQKFGILARPICRVACPGYVVKSKLTFAARPSGRLFAPFRRGPLPIGASRVQGESPRFMGWKFRAPRLKGRCSQIDRGDVVRL
jgi:hypothetical protein